MNAYLASVLENVKAKHGGEPEFCQTVEEVLSSLDPVIEQHPEYEKFDILNRMTEPERMFTFRVVWMDDAGKWHTNRGWRCQFNGAIGPYKGGLRFQKNVNESNAIPPIFQNHLSIVRWTNLRKLHTYTFSAIVAEKEPSFFSFPINPKVTTQ